MTPDQYAFFAVLSGFLAFSAAWSGAGSQPPRILIPVVFGLAQVPAAILWGLWLAGYGTLIGLSAPLAIAVTGLVFAAVAGPVATIFGKKALKRTSIAAGCLILPAWILFFGGFFLLPVVLMVVALISLAQIARRRPT